MGRALSEVQSTLEFMEDYVVIHFADEEELQRQIGYPGLEKHAAIHAAFREEILKFAERVAAEGFDEEKFRSLELEDDLADHACWQGRPEDRRSSAPKEAAMRVEYINPFYKATIDVLDHAEPRCKGVSSGLWKSWCP